MASLRLFSTNHQSPLLPSSLSSKPQPSPLRFLRNPSRQTPIPSVLHFNRKPELAGGTPRIVVITSGKGGVRKKTTTANVGLSLARYSFKVFAIDMDLGIRNLDLLLGLENRVNYTVVEVLNGDYRLDQALA